MEENNFWLELGQISIPIFIILLGGLGWLYKYEKEKRKEIENKLSDKKYDTYKFVIDVFFKIIANVKNKNSKADYTKDITEINKRLFVYSSDSVLRKFFDWTQAARKNQNSLTYFAELLIEIRKDMGNKNSKIDANDFLNHLLTDFEDAKKQGLVK